MPPRTIARPIQPPAPDQVRRLLATARDRNPDLACFVFLAAATGARRGELCGLRWTDLDAAEGQLDIVRTIIIVDGACVEAHKDPTVPPDRARRARQRRRAEKRAKEADLELGERAFVFSHDSDGQRPWRPDSISRAFRHLCHQAGFDGVRLHDLRHFAATRLLTAGIDLRTVAGRLGHSKASTTLNVYASFVPDADRRAAQAMSRLLGRTARRSVPRPGITA